MSLEATYTGLRVLDLATNIAGPYAAMILGDMGADVIKIERPPHGDDTRSLEPRSGGQSTVFLAVNRNKRSILLDLKSAEGRETLLRLVETADVVIESFPPGLAAKLSLTYDDFRGRKADIILCSISAFGDGPIGSQMPGYDALVQAVSGLMSFTGNPGEPTVRIAPSILDLSTGMWAAIGVMGALTRRIAGQGGDHVRPTLIDSAFNIMNHQLLGYLATGAVPQKLGSGAPSASPYAVYQAMDGELLIATASEAQFPRLCSALGVEQLATDPRFLAMALRIENRDALDSAIAEVVAEGTVEHWIAVLGDAGISCGRVNTVADACELPVVMERALWIGASNAEGVIPQLRLPIGSSQNGVRQPPLLDEHSAEILATLT